MRQVNFQLAIFATLVILLSACEFSNGERFVSGMVPVDPRTEVAEKLCDSFLLPPESRHMVTRVMSKSQLGVVTKKYSTPHDCLAIDAFFRNSFGDREGFVHWSSRVDRPFFFNPDTYSTYGAPGFLVDVSCDGWKNLDGSRKFYLSCSWNEN